MESIAPLIISLVQELIKDTPALIKDFQEIFSKPNPTPDDWEALRTKVKTKGYRDYVPDTQLPPGEG